MHVKNHDLAVIGNFLVKLSLPANVSRARTKLVKEIDQQLAEYNEARQEMFRAHDGQLNETTGNIEFSDSETEELAVSDLTELADETAIIQPKYAEQLDTLKAYFNDWNEKISGDDALAFDVFFDALNEADGKDA